MKFTMETLTQDETAKGFTFACRLTTADGKKMQALYKCKTAKQAMGNFKRIKFIQEMGEPSNAYIRQITGREI